MDKFDLRVLSLLLLYYYLCNVAIPISIKSLISPYHEVLSSIGFLPPKLDSFSVSISLWEIVCLLNLPISMITTHFCVTKHWLTDLPIGNLLTPLRSMHIGSFGSALNYNSTIPLYYNVFSSDTM